MCACLEIRLESDAKHLYELFASYVRHCSVHVLVKTRIFPWINYLYLALINRAGGLYRRILTEVASIDRTQ